MASSPPPPTTWFPPPSSSSAATTSARSCSSRDESPGGSDLRPAGGLPAGRDAENRHSRPHQDLWRQGGSRRRRPRHPAGASLLVLGGSGRGKAVLVKWNLRLLHPDAGFFKVAERGVVGPTGRANVCTPDTNSPTVRRLVLEKKHYTK